MSTPFHKPALNLTSTHFPMSFSMNTIILTEDVMPSLIELHCNGTTDVLHSRIIMDSKDKVDSYAVFKNVTEFSFEEKRNHSELFFLPTYPFGHSLAPMNVPSLISFY